MIGSAARRVPIDMVTTHTRSWSSAALAARSLLWTLLLPGVFAGYVPWRYFGLDRVRGPFTAIQLVGVFCMAIGAGLLAACIWEFAHRGRGTLSPVDPPRQLVVRGLYKYVRNPMYLSVTALVLGEALVTRSRELAIYWAVWFSCAHLFVIGYEEPNLRERFGESYDTYTRRVGRWIPRLREAKG